MNIKKAELEHILSQLERQHILIGDFNAHT